MGRIRRSLCRQRSDRSIGLRETDVELMWSPVSSPSVVTNQMETNQMLGFESDQSLAQIAGQCTDETQSLVRQLSVNIFRGFRQTVLPLLWFEEV